MLPTCRSNKAQFTNNKEVILLFVCRSISSALGFLYLPELVKTRLIVVVIPSVAMLLLLIRLGIVGLLTVCELLSSRPFVGLCAMANTQISSWKSCLFIQLSSLFANRIPRSNNELLSRGTRREGITDSRNDAKKLLAIDFQSPLFFVERAPSWRLCFFNCAN